MGKREGRRVGNKCDGKSGDVKEWNGKRVGDTWSGAVTVGPHIKPFEV